MYSARWAPTCDSLVLLLVLGVGDRIGRLAAVIVFWPREPVCARTQSSVIAELCAYACRALWLCLQSYVSLPLSDTLWSQAGKTMPKHMHVNGRQGSSSLIAHLHLQRLHSCVHYDEQRQLPICGHLRNGVIPVNGGPAPTTQDRHKPL